MKYILIALIAIVIIFPSCQKGIKPVTYMNTGYIRGQDISNIVCGYGYVITMGSKVQKFADPLPAGSGIDLKTATFPIKVRFNSHIKPDPNPCHFIVIDAIEKID